MPDMLHHADLSRLTEADLAQTLDIHRATLMTQPRTQFDAIDWTHFGKEVRLLDGLLTVCAKYQLLPNDLDEASCLHELDRRQVRRRIATAELA